MNKIIVETKSLSKAINRQQILKNINIVIYENEIHGLIGKNGAGKTTTLRCILGLLKVDGGYSKLMNCNSYNIDISVKRKIGVVLDEGGIYENLTGKDNLLFYGRIYGMADLDILNYAKKYSTDFNLSDSLDKKVREYSKGMKQNLKIMKEVMHKPIILFLDEPFSGLDPTARIFLRKLLLRLKTQGISSLIISHDLDQIQKISDKITLIESGNTVFTKDVNELISTDEKIYIINICTFDELTKLKNIKDITILKATENIVTFSVNNEVFNIVKLLNENAINYSEIYQKKIYLEQYFER